MTIALNQFISRLADRCKPFFLLMNKWKGFEWIKKCALAFQRFKEYLSRPLIMFSPEMDEVLFTYITVALHVVSLVLVQVDSNIQRPVYYISKSLHEVKVCYLLLEKAIWWWYMLHVNSPITSKHTQLLSQLSFCSELYSEVLITRGGLLNGAQS